MKTNLDQFFKLDDQASKDGKWVPISEGVEFLVKPFKKSNPQIKKALEIHYKPYARQIEMGSLSDEKAQEIEIKIFVNSCIVDWKGIEIDGVVQPYNSDLAITLLESLPELFDTLMRYAEDSNNYKEVLGNS
jgi:hypothetical protein